MSYTSQNITIQILIIDNNHNFANIFAKLLEIKGFSVTVEATFKTGLQYLGHKPCHIVFVDIPLLGYDKKQVLNLLNENNIFKKLYVFLFSSIDLDDTELDEWKKSGLYLYLKKPVKRNVIIKALDNVRVQINSIISQTPSDSSVDSEPTSEQLEKLNQLEKQIQKLENIKQPASAQEYSLPRKADIPHESKIPSDNNMDYSVLKNILSNLRLQSVLEHTGSSLMISGVENNHKDNEIIKKEIEKTRFAISTLKNEILMFDDGDSQDLQSVQTLVDKKPHKIKKKTASVKAKPHKIKKK